MKYILLLTLMFFCYSTSVVAENTQPTAECSQTVLAKDRTVDQYGDAHYTIWATNDIWDAKETGKPTYRKYEVDLVIYDKYNIGDVSCFKKEENTSSALPILIVIVLCFMLMVVGAIS